jgi:DNA (cytosine-5)-methyltransferase 1
MIKIADFFSGIGGIGKGFEDANKNYKVVYSNDIDKWCKKTYDANNSVKTELKSISDIDEKKLPDFDIFCGGFPCQPFSIAGKREGFKDERSNVFFDIVRILKYKKPMCLFLENVKNMVTHDKGNTFKKIKKDLEDLGYILYYKVLNGSEYGNIPQNRERIYIIGFLEYEAEYEFPEKIDLSVNISDILEKDVDDSFYYNESSSIYDKLKDITKKNTIYQYRRYYIRENKSDLCPTLTANMGTGGHNVPLILDDKGIRKLTPVECFKFQGFDNIIIPNGVSNAQLYKQAGNSVSTTVIKRIASYLYKYLII